VAHIQVRVSLEAEDVAFEDGPRARGPGEGGSGVAFCHGGCGIGKVVRARALLVRADLGTRADFESELPFDDAASALFVAACGVGLLDGGELQEVRLGCGVADELGVGHGAAVVLEDSAHGDELIEGGRKRGRAGRAGCPACSLDDGGHTVGFGGVPQGAHLLHELEPEPLLVGAGILEAPSLLAGQVPAALFACGDPYVDGARGVGVSLGADVARDEVHGGAARGDGDGDYVVLGDLLVVEIEGDCLQGSCVLRGYLLGCGEEDGCKCGE